MSTLSVKGHPSLRMGGIASTLTMGSRESFVLEMVERDYTKFKGENPLSFPAKTRRLVPIVILFLGRRGRGKSLGMTWFEGFQKARWRAAGIQCYCVDPYTCTQHPRVASNYWTFFSDILRPDLVSDLTAFPPWAKSLLVGVDEVGTQAANRLSMMRANINFGMFLTQIRKGHNEIMFTTQHPQWTDKLVISQVDIFLKVELDDSGRFMDIKAWDWWGLWTGNDSRKHWPPQDSDLDWEFTIFNTHRMFDMYDTDQIIPPAWAPNRQKVLTQQWGGILGPDYQEQIGHPEPEIEVDERTAALLRSPPKSVKELVERQEGSFDLNNIMGFAKQIDPKIAQISDLIAIIEGLGYTWHKTGFDLICEKNGGGS